MFFKRVQPKAPKYNDQVKALAAAGYETSESASEVVVRRQGYAARVREDASGAAVVAEVGLAIGGEIAVLTDLGFQKIFLTPGGRKTPALAEHLKGLHEFSESLGKNLGSTLFYNDGLGTTNGKHIYDRVEGRDHGHTRRAWERTSGD